jgi:hypothetical protein
MDADTGVPDTMDADTAVTDGDASDTDVAVPDAPGTSDSDSASDVGPPATEKSVFVTSGTYDANLGGLAGADAKCQASADAVGLLGEYKAWLSDGTLDAATRLSHATAPYRLVDGTQLASDWTGLTTAALSAPIDKDESGNAVAPTNMGTNCEDTDYSVVWTNSQEDGTTVWDTYDCSDWTSTANPDTWTAVGSTKELSSWAYGCNNVDACQLFARLFCFEQ